MGLRFIGGAVQEFQQQAIISYDAVAAPDWLLTLGINPTWEAIGAQLVITAVAVGSILVMHRRRPAAIVLRKEVRK